MAKKIPATGKWEDGDLKGKPIADKVIAEQKPLPKPPMKPPEKGGKPKKVGY